MATTTKKEQCAAGESSIGGGPPPDSSLSGLPQQGCEQAADQGIRLNGLQAGLVTLDVNKYRRAIRPTNIFDVLPQPIFEQMIRGFFYRIRKGVTLLWSEYDSDQRRWIFSENNRLDPFDYTNPEDRQFYNEVCWEYRSTRNDKKCRECDQKMAQEYADGNRTGAHLYRCWLGLDDLTYPLKVGNKHCLAT